MGGGIKVCSNDLENLSCDKSNIYLKQLHCDKKKNASITCSAFVNLASMGPWEMLDQSTMLFL